MDYFNNYEDGILKYKQENPERIYIINPKSKKMKHVINFIPSGFDIETYTQYTKDAKGHVQTHYTNMYIWQCSIGPDVYFGRTWGQFSYFLNLIKRHFTNEVKKTIIFIHNLSFEFSFMGKELQAYGHDFEIFARKKRHPMKAVMDNRIIFLDSALITGFSLEKLAENYTNINKLKGDLDYTLPRNSQTVLSDQELNYCRNDVLILSSYAEYYATTYLQEGFIPMTSNMISSRVVQTKVKELNAQKDAYFLMKRAYPKTQEQYDYIMQYFTGAYVHGMLRNLFIKHGESLQYDVNSEYPYAIMNSYFPMGSFKVVRNLDDIEELMENYCCLIECTLTNFKTRTGVTIISKNKSFNAVKAQWDNGRLYSCESIDVMLTELDIQTLRLHSDFDIKYNRALYTKRGYLPKYFRLAIAELFAAKNELKGVPDKKVEYNEEKRKLNGQYGSLCTKILPIEISFTEDGWEQQPKEINFESIMQRKVTLPQWAIWTTSSSRALILGAVARIRPEDYYYSDTDSIKCANRQYIIDMFDELNTEIKQKNERWIQELNLRELYPNTDFSQMGCFAREEDLESFKTLGSKRYIGKEKETGHLHETIAGLPVGSFSSYCDKHNLDYFDAFSENGLYFTEAESNKLTTYYCDEKKTFKVTDYQGNSEWYVTESYVSLIPTTFNLSISEELAIIYENHFVN